MSSEDTSPSTETSTKSDTDMTDTAEGSERTTRRDVSRLVRYALLAGLTLLALIALVRLYFAVSNAIDLWITREFRSLFHAAFNLVVLVLAAIGISWQIRSLP